MDTLEKSSPMKRRLAREYVLQFLYAMDIKEKLNNGKDYNFLHDELDNFWEQNEQQDNSIISFANELIEGTLQNIEKIDRLIIKYANKWDLERMLTVDRNILRFAIYEILYRHDIPFQVTINEAVEVAKKYSTKESASFINGILDKIAKNEGAGES
ncbi:transcription antitermination factor NusB [Thermodesulfovibrio hydrogeniphilus]